MDGETFFQKEEFSNVKFTNSLNKSQKQPKNVHEGFICFGCLSISLKIARKKGESSPFHLEEEIHSNYGCDKCEAYPIKGRRFSCSSCKNFDLCESCFQKKDKFHDKSHKFTRMMGDVSDEGVLKLPEDVLGEIFGFVDCTIDSLLLLSLVCRKFASFFRRTNFGFLTKFNLGNSKIDSLYEYSFLRKTQKDDWYERNKSVFNKDEKFEKVLQRMLGDKEELSFQRIEKFQLYSVNRDLYLSFLSLIPKNNSLKQYDGVSFGKKTINELTLKKIKLSELEIVSVSYLDYEKFYVCSNLKKLSIINWITITTEKSLDLSKFPKLKFLQLKLFPIPIKKELHESLEELILLNVAFREFEIFPNLKKFKHKIGGEWFSSIHQLKSIKNLEHVELEGYLNSLTQTTSNLPNVRVLRLDKLYVPDFEVIADLKLEELYIENGVNVQSKALEVKKSKKNETLKKLSIVEAPYVLYIEKDKMLDMLKYIQATFIKLEELKTITSVFTNQHAECVSKFKSLKKLELFVHGNKDFYGEKKVFTHLSKMKNLQFLSAFVETPEAINTAYGKYLEPLIKMSNLRELYTNFNCKEKFVKVLGNKNSKMEILKVGKCNSLPKVIKIFEKGSLLFFCCQHVGRKNRIYQRKAGKFVVVREKK